MWTISRTIFVKYIFMLPFSYVCCFITAAFCFQHLAGVCFERKLKNMCKRLWNSLGRLYFASENYWVLFFVISSSPPETTSLKNVLMEIMERTCYQRSPSSKRHHHKTAFFTFRIREHQHWAKNNAVKMTIPAKERIQTTALRYRPCIAFAALSSIKTVALMREYKGKVGFKNFWMQRYW